MAKKPFKVFSTSALAAVIASSVIVPTAAFAAETPVVNKIKSVIFENEGNNFEMSYKAFTDAKSAGIALPSVKYVVGTNDKQYNLKDFTDAKSGTTEGTVASALEILDEKPELVQDIKAGTATVGANGEIKYELPVTVTVESVTAINANAVTVTFPEVITAIENANVVVKDGEGKVVETKPLLLAEGTTQADFEFVKSFPVDHKFTGVWTINGKEYSFDAINQLADIVAAAVTTPNQIKLQAALDAAGITYADETRIADYLAALTVDTTVSLEAVQTAITKVDEAASNGEANAAIVKAVVEAKTQAQLLKVLQANFDVVNSEWIVEYESALDVSVPENVQEIQTTVAEVNFVKVQPKVSAANLSLDSEKVSEARALVTKWIPADKEDAAPSKAIILDALNLEDALIAVNNAKTNSALKSALTNLDTLENSLLEKYKDVVGFDKSDEFDIKTVVDANLTAYRTAIEAAAVGSKNQRKDIQKIVTEANTSAVSTAKAKVLEDLNAVTVKTTAADVVALLEKSQKLHDQANKVNSAYAEAYKTAVVETEATGVPAVKFAAADAVNTLVGLVNNAQDSTAQLAAVNTAKTSTEMRSALTTLALADEVTNADYINTSATAKLEVAELVLAARAELAEEKFVDAAAVEAAITSAIETRTALIGGVNTAATISAMDLAIEELGYKAYSDLNAATQLDVAEAFIAKFTADKDNVRVNYNTLTSIKAGIDAAITAVNNGEVLPTPPTPVTTP